ncbi:hypothetical protein ACIPWF_14730 [Paenarthrobacter sp. NPDC089989]|uniref:hypothetical protein n=1 Tax=unclassified Paenarthrobacter TaxID=2634190 RepID=UPI0038279A87
MGKIGVALAIAGGAVLLGGCSLGPVACPAVGQVTGVSVTVAGSYSSSVGTLHLKVCQDSACHEGDLALYPGTVAVDQGCNEAGVCSATPTFDGTVRGLLELPALSETPMDATMTGTSPSGTALPVRTLTFTPKGSYPFDEQCQRFITASLVLDAEGLRQE